IFGNSRLSHPYSCSHPYQPGDPYNHPPTSISSGLTPQSLPYHIKYTLLSPSFIFTIGCTTCVCHSGKSAAFSFSHLRAFTIIASPSVVSFIIRLLNIRCCTTDKPSILSEFVPNVDTDDWYTPFSSSCT